MMLGVLIRIIFILALNAAAAGSAVCDSLRYEGHVLKDFDGAPLEITLTGADGKKAHFGLKQISPFQMLALRGQAMIVYGTQKNQKENEAAAREELTAWYASLKSCPNCPPPDLRMAKDTEITNDILSSQDIILIGDDSSNSVVAQLRDKLPVKLSGSTVDLGEAGKLTSVVMGRFIVPNPLNKSNILMVRFGTLNVEPDDVRWSVAYRWTAALTYLWHKTDYSFITSDGTIRGGYFAKPDRTKRIVDSKTMVTIKNVFQDPYQNWEKRETSHFIFHYAKGSSVDITVKKDGNAWDSKWEKLYTELSGELQLNSKRRTHLFFFDDWEESKRSASVGYYHASTAGDRKAAGLTDAAYGVILLIGNGKTMPGKIARHELTHILAENLAPSTVIFNSEGLACAMEGDKPGLAGGKTLAQWEYDYLKQHSSFPPLSALFQADRLNIYPETESYPLAASFTRFLLKRYGLQRYKEYYKLSAEQSPVYALKKVYSRGLDEIEKEWLQDSKSACRAIQDSIELETEAVKKYSESRFQQACELAQKAIELNKEVILAYFIVGASLNRLEKADPDKTIETLQKYISRAKETGNPEQPWAYIELGYAYDLKDNRQEALRWYNKAVELPEDRGSKAEARKRLREPYRNGGKQHYAEGTYHN